MIPFKKFFTQSNADIDNSMTQLKDLLYKSGYTLKRSNRGSYTIRSKMEVGIDPREDKLKYVGDPNLNSSSLRELFTLAHEVGHTLQWDGASKRTRREFGDWLDNTDPMPKEQSQNLYDMINELDAWVAGLQFIPNKYKKVYKKYAYDSYRSYMLKQPYHYNGDMILKNLLYKLNYDEQLPPPTSLNKRRN